MRNSNRELFLFDELLAEDLKDDEFKQGFLKESLKINIINELTKIRKQKNLTQKDMAKIVGVSQGNISRFEKGKVEPTLEFIENMSSKLGYKLNISFISIEE